MPRFSDEQIRTIITNPTRPRVVTYPGHPDVRIGVRALDDVDLDNCRVEAQRKLRDIAKKRGWDVREMSDVDPTLMERFVEREIVLRAFVDADTIDHENPVPFFSNEHQLSRIGSTGVTDLMELYGENQEWQNPNLTLDAAGEEELIAALGKGPGAELSLTGIEPAMLRRLLISTVKRLNDFRTGKSSTSKSSGSPTTPG